jgi:peptidyl-prolyl cis-trans isomerase C
MKKIHLIGAAIAVGAAVSGCGKADCDKGTSHGACTDPACKTETAEKKDPNETVLKVNGKELKRGALDADVEKIIAAQGDKIPAEQKNYMKQMLRNQLAQAFVIENALVAKAKAAGYVVTDADRTAREKEFVDAAKGRPGAPKTFAEFAEKFPLGKDRALREFENGILIDKMIKAESAKNAPKKDYSAEAKKIIDDIKKKNAAVASSATDALKKIKALQDELAKTPAKDVAAKFAELAKKNSACPSSAKGGYLGEFTRGQMVPEFDKVAFTQPIGKVSDPVKTQFGQHLLLVTKKTPAVEAKGDKPATPEKVQASHILIKSESPRPVPKTEDVVKNLQQRDERETVQTIIQGTLKATAIEAVEEFKHLLPQKEEKAVKPVAKPAQKPAAQPAQKAVSKPAKSKTAAKPAESAKPTKAPVEKPAKK